MNPTIFSAALSAVAPFPPHVTTLETAESITIGDATATFLVESQDSGNAWSLMAYDTPPGFVAGPPHVHAETTELFYVLSGTLTVLVGERSIDVQAGSCVVITPGTVHTFSNASGGRTRMLALASPGGHDAFLRELLALIATSPSWPPQDPTALHALAARYDTRYLPRTTRDRAPYGRRSDPRAARGRAGDAVVPVVGIAVSARALVEAPGHLVALGGPTP